MTETAMARVWRPTWPCSPRHALWLHRRGAGDPTFLVLGSEIWRGIRTPEGPATLRIVPRPTVAEIHVESWGAGAAWVLDSVPDLLGAADDVTGFEPRHPVVVDAWRRYPHARYGRTGLVMEALVPAIIEQKVTGQEAFAGFRRLVHRFGERAPGPGRELELWLQPGPHRLRTIPSWEWLRLHIDPARSRVLVTAARVADALERTTRLAPEEAERRLRTLPGIGRWTAAEVRQRAFGDADAVSYGDYHVAKDVGWALTGTPFDDIEMEAYLEPWRPHRGRVTALVAMAGHKRPRHGAKMAPRTHLPGGSVARRS